MANLFFTGFEKFVTTYVGWPNLSGAGNPIWDIQTWINNTVAASTTAPRGGGSGQCILCLNNDTTAIRSLGGNYTNLFTGAGFLCRAASLPATPTNCDVVFYDGTTAQVGYAIRGDGSISVHRGSTVASTELGRSSTGVITPAGASALGADYKMVEMGVVFHASTGTVTIKVAGVTVLTLTGQNTAPSGIAQANRFGLQVRSNNANRWDDLYINDNSGSSPDNTFYGESFVVEGIQPNGDGNSSQWIGSDGNSTNNYLLVDDTGNDDTDYVKSSTVNDLDTYAFANLTNASGTVVGVAHFIIAKKDDVVLRKISSALRISTTNYISATELTLLGEYRNHMDRWLLSPATAVKFTISEINGMEAGQKVTT